MIEELLEVLAAGSQQQQQRQQQQRQQAEPKSPWMDLLEGVLGGGAQQQQQRQQPQSAGGIGDILEAVLGGGRRQGQGQVSSNPMLAPFVGALSEKLGISPQMAAVIVSAAFGLIASKMMGGGKKATAQTGASAGGIDLDDLLDGDFMEKSGVAERVAKQTGMDKSEATDGLRKAMEMLGVIPKGQSAPKQQRTTKRAPAKTAKRGKSGDLKHLLDTWKIG